MRILVTDGMDKTAMAQLREAGHEVVEQFYEPDQLGAALREFDAVVVRSKTKVRANHIDEAKGGKLKLIIRGGVGVDNIDVKYAEANGITVKNTPKASSQSVAELAMGHMFSCARYLSIAGHTMREGKWEKDALTVDPFDLADGIPPAQHRAHRQTARRIAPREHPAAMRASRRALVQLRKAVRADDGHGKPSFCGRVVFYYSTVPGITKAPQLGWSGRAS